MAAATSSNRKSPRSYRCDICGRNFDSNEELNSHKRIEHGETSKPPAGVG
jgi:hypothetical protein